jgi:hypothetical protein
MRKYFSGTNNPLVNNKKTTTYSVVDLGLNQPIAKAI